MAVHGSEDDPVAERAPDDPEPTTATETTLVAAHETCPGRTVFTERENSDAWIATDLTVELER